ncbi:hypothetical protein Q9L58_004042 [Maublancomyces gigas]|uniref:Uncharacterized protein n=1 Tax=Discina gigas TaxID=1032678 RepID=A0ABR3GMA5_9PEZI
MFPNAIAAGLQRLPVEGGGVPQHVADTCLELVGLYATPGPVIDLGDSSDLGTIVVIGPDTIIVGLPSKAAETIGLLTTGKRKREETPDDCSDGGSSAASDQTGRSNDTQLTRQLYKRVTKRRPGLLEKGQKGRKKMAEMKAMSEVGSLASSGQPGECSDIPQKRTIPQTRAATRAQAEEDAKQGGIANWQGDLAQMKRQQGGHKDC